MPFTLDLTPQAQADLDQIVAERDEESDDGAKMARAILREIRELENSPRMGRVLPKQGDPDLRELIVLPYRVIYEVSDRDQIVTIHRVWHWERGEVQFAPSA